MCRCVRRKSKIELYEYLQKKEREKLGLMEPGEQAPPVYAPKKYKTVYINGGIK